MPVVTVFSVILVVTIVRTQPSVVLALDYIGFWPFIVTLSRCRQSRVEVPHGIRRSGRWHRALLHNYLDDSCIIFLRDGRSAYLVFRRLEDSNSSSGPECREVTDGAPISSASVELPMGVSYDLYYDQVLEMYAPFVAPNDSVRKTPF